MKTQWIKVKNLKAGAKICITGDGVSPSEIMFDEILEIKHVGREQVYDIEVEGTHNFVGNGIIAHNTAIFGVGEGSTPTVTTLRGAAGAGTDIAGANFTFDASNGTGTGGSGALIFRTAPVGSTGSTANTLAEIMRITPGGNVGIGTTAPSAQLEISGSSAIKASGTAWDNPSDVRLKNILGNYSKGLAEILEVNPVKYSFKEGNALGLPQDGEHIGIIAQDIQGIFPEAVKTGASGYLTFQADPLIWASVNAIKELDSKFEALSDTPGVGFDSPGVDLISLEERVKNLEDKIASSSALNHPTLTESHPELVSGSTPSAQILNQVQNDNTSTLNLTPPEILLSTTSAQLYGLSALSPSSDATISGKLTAYDLSVQNIFKSLGDAFLGNTTVAGNFSVDGTMSITGDSLNSIACNSERLGITQNTGNSDNLTTRNSDSSGSQSLSESFRNDCGILYLQNSPFSEGVDFFNGQVTIDKTGKIVVQEIVAKTVTTEKLIITKASLTTNTSDGGTQSLLGGGSNNSLGTTTIPAGELTLTVKTSALTKNSKVFLTPNSPAVLGVTKKIPEDSFTVELDKVRPADLDFDWWIVDTK